MCPTLEGVVPLARKKALGAPEARKQWCQCAHELGEMVSWEAKNNPRYKNMRSLFSHELNPPPFE